MVQKRKSSKSVQKKVLPENLILPEVEESKPKKRKLNGYMIWSQEERKQISKHEVFSGRDIARILGSRWQKLSEEEKQKWKDIASQDSIPVEEKVEKKEKKPGRPPGRPPGRKPKEKTDFKNKKGKTKYIEI